MLMRQSVRQPQNSRLTSLPNLTPPSRAVRELHEGVACSSIWSNIRDGERVFNPLSA
jgi:hypothetical protein